MNENYHILIVDDDNRIRELIKEYLEEKNFILEVSQAAASWLANIGHDSTYGARPLKRAIQKELETPIAKGILSGKYNNNQTIKVDLEGGKIKLL